MYIPKLFAETDDNRIVEFMQAHAFVTLVSVRDGAPQANHVPVLVKKDSGITLCCHLARQNPQWRDFEQGANALVIFQGPHCYISPSWYEKPGVPTWNFTAVHAYGEVRTIHDNGWLKQHVTALAASFEGNNEAAWQPDFPEKMLNAVVGLEITVNEIQAKQKLSQNKSVADREKVISVLRDHPGENEQAIAGLLERVLSRELSLK